MKKSFFPVIAALFLVGCASSERAFRMSGGVLDTYSAPKSFRTRSEKFQKMDQMSVPHRANKTEVAGINDTLVNIWPFYFRSNNYFSVLWPMIDWDPYGMAIRPFYNQEGDDYSILFPLSSWNIADKSGWVANFRWTRTGFGFIPLTYQNRTKDKFWCYYTPFFIANRDYRKLGVAKNALGNEYLLSHTEDFTEFMLGYYGVDRYLDTGNWDPIYWHSAETSDYVKYEIWKSGRKEIKNGAELEALRKELVKTFVPYERRYGGFFPLFHISRTPYSKSYSWNIAGLIADVEKSPRYYSVKIGGSWLFNYTTHKYDIDNAVHSGTSFEKKFFTLPILSGKEVRTHIKVTETVKKLRTLRSNANYGKFAQMLPKVNAVLKELDPNAKVPEFINNETLLRLYIDDFIKDYCKKQKFEFYTTGKFNSPLYSYEWSPEKREWFIFVLLTGGEKWQNGNRKWFSLPLLSGAGYDKNEDYCYILPPIAYINKTKRYEKVGKYISASDAKWPKYDRDNIESTDIYGACGLFYRGRVKFLVAKNGLSNKTLNELYSDFNALHLTKRSLDRQEKQYTKDLKLANAIKDRNKIEYYEKMIALEKLKIRRTKIDKSWVDFKKDIEKTREKSKQVNFKFDVSDWADEKQLDRTLENLYAQTTEVREKSDLGNGLFFRKENYYNGDWKWRIFLNMAGGEKDGTKVSSHFLHFLYRNRTDGNRMEKLIFPFISIQKDGNNSKTSFLGRIYQKSVIDGKTSGYILFIPFGDK